MLVLGTGTAAASKQAIGYFGTENGSGTLGGEFNGSGDVAVNSTGAGLAEKGDIYVVDGNNNRIQRFRQDDNGTPANPFDDTYPFVSAWGAGVDSAVAGSGYEICTVAANCTAAIQSEENGAFNDGLGGIDVDQDSGVVYVADGGPFQSGNRRVSAYEGDGTFLRSFGWDVVQAGPGEEGTGFEVCVAADGDVCKAGSAGSGVGQISFSASSIVTSQPDGNPGTGTLYLADPANHRVNTYNLDGSSPGSFGSAATFPGGPNNLAVDSRGIIYASIQVNSDSGYNSGSAQIQRYDGFNVNGSGVGFLAPITDQTTAVSGGPGNGLGSDPYEITFAGPLGRSDVSQIVASNGTVPLSGGAGASVTTTTPGGPGADEVQAVSIAATAGQFRLTFDGQTTTDLPFDASPKELRNALEALSSVPPPPLSNDNNSASGLEVDPDSDGAGPDTDTLYVLSGGLSGTTVVQQFGPINAPGLLVPPSTEDDAHGAVAGFNLTSALGLDTSNGRLFVRTSFNIGGPADHLDKVGVYVLDTAGSPPTASLDSVSDVTATAATIHGTIDPNGGPPVTYRLEYSLDGVSWKSMPEVLVGVQESAQSISAVLDPLPSGLEPATFYHVRIRVVKAFTPPLITSEATFTTLPAPPMAETTGAPIRTTTSAQLGGRVIPRNSTTTYFFEYGNQGRCDSNPCTQTDPQPAGSGNFMELVSEEVEGLQPNTTYHYRIVADNGNPDGPDIGEDKTVTTRGTEAPLSHGHFPGPPGSDRAWELVSSPNSGGNPIATDNRAISDDGSRAIWELAGGSPLSETGGFNQFYSERTPSGWLTKKVYPPRSQLPGPNWHASMGPSDLSSFVALDLSFAGGGFALFRMTPGAPAVKLHEVASEGEWGGFEVVADDGSRVLMATLTSADPEHPTAAQTRNLFDVTSGSPHLVNLLPGNTLPNCGILVGGFGSPSPYGMYTRAARANRWISTDGNLAFFQSSGNDCGSEAQLYMRDFAAAETKLISGPALSGRVCGSGFIKSNPEGVFFWTKTRLASEDTAPASCSDESDGDVYRYDLESGSLDCVTCVVPNVAADVFVGSAATTQRIAVADDGSRVYFQSPHRLLSGAVTPGIYRVDVESGDLAYVGSGLEDIGNTNAMSDDGSLFFFAASDPSLNALGAGVGNAGTKQLYRYDDTDRSLICISCPQDGSAPRGAAAGPGTGADSPSPNTKPLSEDGVFAFATPTPLVGADQNTAGPGEGAGRGTDAYEWRDGRLFLVSDGLTDWVGGETAPTVMGMTPSGRDILFSAAAQYTPDALDNYRRLYDARIGGGFTFPKPPPPCPLEVCQGTPKGAPEEQAPGTGSFAGPGSSATQRKPSRCSAGQRKVRRAGKTRCVSKKSHVKNKANRNRRTAR